MRYAMSYSGSVVLLVAPGTNGVNSNEDCYLELHEWNGPS